MMSNTIDPEWKKMMEAHIAEYLSGINFKQKDFNINQIQQELKDFCGVEPGVTVKWDVKNEINELKKSAGVEDFMERIEEPVEVEIIFVNENNIPVKINFYI